MIHGDDLHTHAIIDGSGRPKEGEQIQTDREDGSGRRGPSCEAHQLKIHTTLSMQEKPQDTHCNCDLPFTAYLQHQPLQTLNDGKTHTRGPEK